MRLVLADATRRPERSLEVSEIHWEFGVVEGQEALWFRVDEDSTVGIVCTTDPVRTPW